MLIIGDSISIGYTPFVKENLVDKADVFHNEGNAQHTRNGLDKIEKWIGDGAWDIIQINWGLWDLCYRNSNLTGVASRDKVNGELINSVNDYAKNLDALIKLIRRKSDAKIIFVTTTFVPENEPGRFSDDAIKYNKAAKEVMIKNNVLVNDIFEPSILIHEKLGKGEADVHFTKEGYKALGVLITSFLEKEIDSL